MKKFLLFIALTIVASVPLFVSAQGFVPLAPIPGLTQGATADTAGLAQFFNNLYKFAIGMASVLAIIMIIWGGLQYATQDIPGAKQEGKDRILQAILGLILVLSPALVFSIINPSILNLSINLPELDTKSGLPANNTPTVVGMKEQKIGNETIITKGYLINCTTSDCEKEIQACRDASESNIRNPSYYKVVCANTDGRTLSPNAPDSSWFSRAKSCPASQNLAVHCIANKSK